MIIIDEIGTELEAAAARTIAERGVQLVATAHGNSLDNLLVNPTLSDLVGGIQTVTLGDEEARRRHTQKSIQERKAPPTFDVVVEQQSWQELIVHPDVADTVDSMLRGQPVAAEERTRDEETGRVTVRRITAGGMDLPAWGNGGGGISRQPNNFDRSGNRWEPLRQVGPQGSRNGGGGTGLPEREHLRNRGHTEVKTIEAREFNRLAPTGTAPADIERQRSAVLMAPERPAFAERLYQQSAEQEAQPLPLRTLRVYPFGVNRDRLAQSARQLRVPVLITNHQSEADTVITLKNYYRRQPERLQQAEQEHKLIIILKNNTVAQMQHALARIFDIPMSEVPLDDEDEHDSADEPGDPTTRALLETEDAIHQVLNQGLNTAELAPANAYVRRLQHQMATRYNLTSRSRGKEPYRRVKIFRGQE